MQTLTLSRFAISLGGAAALLAGCGVLQPVGATGAMPQTSATPLHKTFTPGHLYVAQGADIAALVYRYPLDANGLPSRTPDGRLDLHFRNPGGIAIGPDGDLYVSDSGDAYACKKEQLCVVDVFAPQASGHAKPIRTLYVPQQPQYVAVDQRGYLDVSVLQDPGTTNVYAPHANGHDNPVNTLTSDGVWALAASHRVAYIQTIDEGVQGIHELPSKHGPLSYSYGPSSDSSNGVATDATHLYADYFWLEGRTFYQATAIWNLGEPGNPLRAVIGTGCRVSFSGGALGYGLAVYKKYIFQGCIGGDGGAGSVYVYNSSKNGKQKPIERLNGGLAGVAVGP